MLLQPIRDAGNHFGTLGKQLNVHPQIQSCSVRCVHCPPRFRCMYPGGQGEYSSFPGGGLLRLHSTYRHDLKMYASDEGRVQMTAAAFAKVH